MKRILLASLLCGLAFTASAQTVTVSDSASDPATAAAQETAPTCLRTTGSHIAAAREARREREARAGKPAPTEVECTGIGRSYSRDDLDRTGVVDLATALKRLDTSIH